MAQTYNLKDNNVKYTITTSSNNEWSLSNPSGITISSSTLSPTTSTTITGSGTTTLTLVFPENTTSDDRTFEATTTITSEPCAGTSESVYFIQSGISSIEFTFTSKDISGNIHVNSDEEILINLEPNETKTVNIGQFVGDKYIYYYNDYSEDGSYEIVKGYTSTTKYLNYKEYEITIFEPNDYIFIDEDGYLACIKPSGIWNTTNKDNKKTASITTSSTLIDLYCLHDSSGDQLVLNNPSIEDLTNIGLIKQYESTDAYIICKDKLPYHLDLNLNFDSGEVNDDITFNIKMTDYISSIEISDEESIPSITSSHTVGNYIFNIQYASTENAGAEFDINLDNSIDFDEIETLINNLKSNLTGDTGYTTYLSFSRDNNSIGVLCSPPTSYLKGTASTTSTYNGITLTINFSIPS